MEISKRNCDFYFGSKINNAYIVILCAPRGGEVLSQNLNILKKARRSESKNKPSELGKKKILHFDSSKNAG